MTRVHLAACAAVASLFPIFAAAQNQPAAPDQPAQQQQADQAQPAADQQMSVEQATADWSDGPKKAAKMMQDKYGQPNGVTATRLVWADTHPFTEIILLNEEIQHDFPVSHKDYLEHVVSLKVPTEKVGELAKYDGSIIVDRTRGMLGARCDTEAHNLLALNLAWDIINDKLDAESARQKYAELVKKEMAGEKPEYLSQLQFQPIENAGDSDVALFTKPGGPQPVDEAQPAGERQPAPSEQPAQEPRQ